MNPTSRTNGEAVGTGGYTELFGMGRLSARRMAADRDFLYMARSSML